MLKRTTTKTKKGNELYERWVESFVYDIFDAYERPSRVKINAWRQIVDDAEQFGGSCPVVCGKNTMVFSAAFSYYDINETLIVRYYTRDNIYEIEVL